MMVKKFSARLGLFLVVFPIISSISYAQAYSQNGGTTTKTNETFSSTTADESAVKVTNSGELTMTNCTVTKSGNTSSGDNSSFYGLNAGILAYNGKITISGGSINTTGIGANGVFAYGTGSIDISDATIKCTAQLGHAVMCSGGGTMTVTNVDMSTAGTNSGAIATDRGSGTITVNGGEITTSGADSPGIYSTGEITVTDATITATSSEGAVIEGLNTCTLNNVTLTSGNNNYGGALILQSMSGDAETGTSTFIINGGSFTCPKGALFFVTNNSAEITLTNVSLSVTSETLINACGTSRWGTTGKNGGSVEFTADTQTLDGNIVIDSVSTFDGTLQNNSILTGSINNSNKGNSVTLTIDNTSSWVLTSNSYLSSITNSDGISGAAVTNITGNGYVVYYDSNLAANNYLGGKTYSLVNGGYLLPLGASIPTVSLPSVPQLVAPALNLANQPTSITLSWNKITNAEKYFAQLSETNSFSTITISDSTSADTSKEIAGLENNTKYYWRVRAKNSAGYGNWSDTGIFSTVMKGDVSCNNIVTSHDAAMILEYIVGLITLDDAQLSAADSFGDKNINAYDAFWILYYVLNNEWPSTN